MSLHRDHLFRTRCLKNRWVETERWGTQVRRRTPSGGLLLGARLLVLLEVLPLAALVGPLLLLLGVALLASLLVLGLLGRLARPGPDVAICMGLRCLEDAERVADLHEGGVQRSRVGGRVGLKRLYNLQQRRVGARQEEAIDATQAVLLELCRELRADQLTGDAVLKGVHVRA